MTDNESDNDNDNDYGKGGMLPIQLLVPLFFYIQNSHFIMVMIHDLSHDLAKNKTIVKKKQL